VKAMKRYSAKLLFQFRVTIGGDSGKMRICEERIIVMKAATAKRALAQAKQKGKKSEYAYSNDEGNPVHFEFIGVMELLELGIECAEDEVWYDIVDRLCPSERRDKLIPPESQLNAIACDLQRNKK
jgi:hypothetical protein